MIDVGSDRGKKENFVSLKLDASWEEEGGFSASFFLLPLQIKLMKRRRGKSKTKEGPCSLLIRVM